ncbi:GAF domain-containing protein [Lentilactobacillus hilgardii]|uniref:GAF domain-containing protein n=1 Tax=Lentilactobacillus hilgardii TaxID=1588 RepID=UPI0021C48F52|nr:GAF domain-containing protein [Lentilactobacillus hilgardii]MCP9331782.1 GAF domain-containing protein [Lentilactobacillus hilgardii]MCP9348349.1 GAF domain-containing protein [Lentilactobacillus hilgardii]MCP9351197.1 GAF domain-containing protein [Lentilactobacillus hilgardii]
MQNVTELVNQQLDALLYEETDLVSNMANASALLNQSLDQINWVGFYRYVPENDELILGPFQGKVACMHIKNGVGVCGTALAQRHSLRVADVHQFAGHIACDGDSKSEIVIPIFKDGQPLGVLDIDSPVLERFSEKDEALLNGFVNIFIKHVD